MWHAHPARVHGRDARATSGNIEQQPEGLQESSRWSESAETTGPDDETNRTPEGCQILRCKDLLRWPV